MMTGPAITQARKFATYLIKSKMKVVTSETMSQDIGLYPDVINDFFAYFDPMVKMDYSYNLRNLIMPLEIYIHKLEQKKATGEPKIRITKKKLAEYDSIAAFIYDKLTIGNSGIVNKNASLSDVDLKVLKRLVNEEQLRRKAEKIKK